jgi:methylmalonyl-CoA mutase C-terminal domain/subunit
MKLLKDREMDEVLVIAGGIIPEDDVEPLKKLGIKAIFGPGTPTGEIIEFIRKHTE